MSHAVIFWMLIAAPLVGSFLALLTIRLPLGEPVIFARSRCRSCSARLGVRDLIPVASFFLSGRRCRRCGAPLSWRYPAVELGALCMALWAAVVVPPHLVVPTAILGWALLTIAFIDAEHLLIPDALSLTVLLGGLFTAAILIDGQIVNALTGVVLGGAMLWAVAALYRYIRGRDGLGFGDVKLMAAGGAWAGWQGLAAILLWAVFLAFAVLLALRLGSGRLTADTAVPFGTFLAAGIWLTWLYGPFLAEFP